MKLILPEDEIEARDRVFKWETVGVPREWEEYFNRSLQVYSFGYENDRHKDRCQDVLIFVAKTYKLAKYNKERKEYLFLHAVPRGHKTRRLLQFKPAGYGTRGYRRVLDRAPGDSPEGDLN